MNHCKAIADLCESFDHLSHISGEESLVCNICVIYPSQGGSHTPGRFTYNIKNDDIYKSTKVLSRDFRNLKTHVKRHFENEVYLKNDCDWQKKEIYKGKCETREHAVGMRIARLCYAGYLIGSSKRNFEQETLKSVLNGLDVGGTNHSSEFYSNFMPFVSEQVTERLKSFFSSRLDHTVFKTIQDNLHPWS